MKKKKAHIILTTKPAHALARTRTHIIEHIIYIFFIQNSKGPRWQQLWCDITFFPMNTHSQCKRTSLNLTRIWHMSLKLHLESFFSLLIRISVIPFVDPSNIHIRNHKATIGSYVYRLHTRFDYEKQMIGFISARLYKWIIFFCFDFLFNIPSSP